jgi:hypothetical protein
MKWLILAVLGWFALERWWLLRDWEADHALAGFGLLLMFLLAITALGGQLLLIWRP